MDTNGTHQHHEPNEESPAEDASLGLCILVGFGVLLVVAVIVFIVWRRDARAVALTAAGLRGPRC